MPKGKLVYSTDPDAAAKAAAKARRESPAPAPSAPGPKVARIRRERKGRGGKTVTVITGLWLAPDELDALARRLRQACATGGTLISPDAAGEASIELQGDQRERAAALLKELGYRVIHVGG